MEKALFIGHSYHQKTKSADFFLDIIKTKYDIEKFYFDPYNDGENVFNILEGKEFSVVVLWQIAPNLNKLTAHVKTKKIVFFPMYDGVAGKSFNFWYSYRNVKIINFSKTLHEKLKNWGFDTHYIQYFPEPADKPIFGNEKQIYFWQRVNQINIKTVEKLFSKIGFDKIHIHKALDPTHEFIEPSEQVKDKIEYSTWYDKKEDMIKDIQKAGIYIAPRHLEGIGMSFLEAMAMGKCVVAPNLPTMNEYIENGKTGYLYDHNNPQPVNLGDIKRIQQNTLEYMKEGYARWEKEKYKILDWIEEKTKVNQKVLKKHFNVPSEIIIYKLFSFLPIVKILKQQKKIRVYLLGFLLLFKINLNASKKKSNFFEKILKKISCIPFKRNIVLLVDNIFEKNANIQDNFSFFEYLYNQKKRMLTPYYILHTCSPYRQELVCKYGKHIILWDSKSPNTWRLKLYFLFFAFKLRYICDSFQAITTLPFRFHNIVKNTPYITSIFMQHGITFFKPDFITPNVYGKNIFDKILVSNDMEKQLFIERGNFKAQDIIQNGLVRWNDIHSFSPEETDKSIFLFFTTRRYLSKIQNLMDSQYVKGICDILDCIKKNINNIKIKIALHHSVAEFLSPVLKKMNVDLVSEEDIFQVKQTASLLITDYSSMCFEFFLQGKPVLFYLFNDADDCRRYGHVLDVVYPYQNKDNLLPNIIKNKEQLIKKINHYIKNNFQLFATEKEKQNLFFYYKSGFCERLEQYLIDHLKERS